MQKRRSTAVAAMKKLASAWFASSLHDALFKVRGRVPMGVCLFNCDCACAVVSACVCLSPPCVRPRAVGM